MTSALDRFGVFFVLLCTLYTLYFIHFILKMFKTCQDNVGVRYSICEYRNICELFAIHEGLWSTTHDWSC